LQSSGRQWVAAREKARPHPGIHPDPGRQQATGKPPPPQFVPSAERQSGRLPGHPATRNCGTKNCAPGIQLRETLPRSSQPHRDERVFGQGPAGGPGLTAFQTTSGAPGPSPWGPGRHPPAT
jgi:hypothetical protein